MNNKKESAEAFFEDVRQSRAPFIADNVGKGFFIILIFFGGLIMWSIYSPLPTGAVVAGNVIVDGNRDEIKHPDGGILDEVFVKNGDYVKKGDPLISLKALSVDAKARQISAEILVTELKYHRLFAELDNAHVFEVEVNIPNKLDPDVVEKLIQAEHTLFRARKLAFVSEQQSMDTNVDIAKSLKPNLEDQLKNVKRQHNLIREELRSMEILSEKGYVSKSQKLELERRAESLLREQNKILVLLGDQESERRSALPLRPKAQSRCAAATAFRDGR